MVVSGEILRTVGIRKCAIFHLLSNNILSLNIRFIKAPFYNIYLLIGSATS